MRKKILLGILVVLIAIQFVRPEKNDSNINTNHVSTKYPVPENVKKILTVACNDCHTNKTEYPWYSKVQPVAWWLDHHVTDGKKHLNLSEFTTMPIAIQNHKLEEFAEMVEKDEMPLPSYTYFGLHSGANLSETERAQLIDWAEAQMKYLEDTYPADSLVMPQRRPAPAAN